MGRRGKQGNRDARARGRRKKGDRAGTARATPPTDNRARAHAGDPEAGETRDNGTNGRRGQKRRGCPGAQRPGHPKRRAARAAKAQAGPRAGGAETARPPTTRGTRGAAGAPSRGDHARTARHRAGGRRRAQARGARGNRQQPGKGEDSTNKTARPERAPLDGRAGGGDSGPRGSRAPSRSRRPSGPRKRTRQTPQQTTGGSRPTARPSKGAAAAARGGCPWRRTVPPRAPAWAWGAGARRGTSGARTAGPTSASEARPRVLISGLGADFFTTRRWIEVSKSVAPTLLPPQYFAVAFMSRPSWQGLRPWDIKDWEHGRQ